MCGDLVVKRSRSDRPILCTPCASQRIEESVMDLLHESGPAYERWVEGMNRAAERATRRLEKSQH